MKPIQTRSVNAWLETMHRPLLYTITIITLRKRRKDPVLLWTFWTSSFRWEEAWWVPVVSWNRGKLLVWDTTFPDTFHLYTLIWLQRKLAWQQHRQRKESCPLNLVTNHIFTPVAMRPVAFWVPSRRTLFVSLATDWSRLPEIQTLSTICCSDSSLLFSEGNSVSILGSSGPAYVDDMQLCLYKSNSNYYENNVFWMHSN